MPIPKRVIWIKRQSGNKGFVKLFNFKKCNTLKSPSIILFIAEFFLPDLDKYKDNLATSVTPRSLFSEFTLLSTAGTSMFRFLKKTLNLESLILDNKCSILYTS